MKTQFTRWFVLLCALTLAHSAMAQSSVSNSTVFMTIMGPNGQIDGEVTNLGREGWHRLMAFSHEIVSPRDSASGLPTGKRQHTPFRIVKLINKGTPTLLENLVKNGKLNHLEISIWSPTSGGPEVRVLTYRLEDVSVASIRPWMPHKGDPGTREYPPAEEITFVYHTIRVIYHNGNITAEDDWEAPVVDTKSSPPKP